jgi:ubiquinone/menaquinone biosynthesis C-methylase UbiE
MVKSVAFSRALGWTSWTNAGLRRGMRVLDVGRGHGDVTLLVAEAVGPAGQVVALDNAPMAVEATRHRTASLANVEVVLGDMRDSAFERAFDAVVGRHVLLHCPTPAPALQRIVDLVAPGGLIVSQEYDLPAYGTSARGGCCCAKARLMHRYACVRLYGATGPGTCPARAHLDQSMQRFVSSEPKCRSPPAVERMPASSCSSTIP